MTEFVATPLSDVVSEAALSRPGAEWGRLGEGATAVVCPGALNEVQTVMRWAGAAGVQVVPVGSGMHVEGDAPLCDYMLLSSSRLATVHIYEPGDLTVTAGAGLRVSALSEVTAVNGQWLPFDPPDFPGRSLGGLAAAGETGPLWAGYGELKNHVLGASVVCGDGRHLELGGRVVKNVAGFDLLRPVVGSRGSLAFITSVTLRLFPRPAVDRVLVLEAPSLEELVHPARAVATASVLPASIVLAGMDGTNRLLVRLHGSRETVDADQRTLEDAVGAGFEATEGESARSLTDAVRDVGLDDDLSIRAFGLPDHLGALLGVLAGLTGVRLVADVYRCSLRVSCARGFDADEALARIRHGMDRFELNAVLERIPGAVPGSLGARHTVPKDVAEIEAGVKRVFDAHGVLWDRRA